MFYINSLINTDKPSRIVLDNNCIIDFDSIAFSPDFIIDVMKIKKIIKDLKNHEILY